MDTKQLAAQLARFVLTTVDIQPQSTIPLAAREDFWATLGIPDIRREIIIDRYLREKVTEVEELATEWIRSPGFHETILQK
jgi:hypothetical protein